MSNNDNEMEDEEEWIEDGDDEEETGNKETNALHQKEIVMSMAGGSLPAVFEPDEIELPAVWGSTPTQVDEVRKNRKMFNMKHGLFVNVPMICKGDLCPFDKTCTIALANRPIAGRCPIEIAAIMDRFDKYCRELALTSEDYFDLSMVKDLVDIEIKLMRANSKLAISAEFIEQVIVAVDGQGNPLTRPELHMATVYEDKLLSRKSKIYNDLNVSRRLKNKNNKVNDPSSFAAQLIQKAMKAQANMIEVMGSVVNADNDNDDIENDDE